MEVSLIIRTLNEEAIIGHCLAAIIKQTKLPTEVLIIDNRSTDKTREIAAEYASLLPLKIIDNPIIGFASGLELGVANALCDYVAFLSADCIPEKKWLESLCNFMYKNDCAVVLGVEHPYPLNDIHYVLEKENPLPSHPVSIKFFNNTNTLYKKNILKTFMPFKGVGEYLYAEDTLMAFDYESKGFKTYLLPVGVKHSKFPTVKEFKTRVYKHAKSSVYLFLHKPLQPRIYLNAYYWILVELYFAIRHWDVRFLKVGYWRLVYTLQGTLAGWAGIIKTKLL